jgi:hypothetical protein
MVAQRVYFEEPNWNAGRYWKGENVKGISRDSTQVPSSKFTDRRGRWREATVRLRERSGSQGERR